jgi:hypothetical protein
VRTTAQRESRGQWAERSLEAPPTEAAYRGLLTSADFMAAMRPPPRSSSTE